MKKLSFILGLFYLLSVVGYGLQIHYCLGQVTDVNVAWLETSCACDGEHGENYSKCCDEKEFFVQVTEAHQSSSSEAKVEVVLPLVAQWCWDCIELAQTNSETLSYPENTGPPKTEAAYKQHCAFIFYG